MKKKTLRLNVKKFMLKVLSIRKKVKLVITINKFQNDTSGELKYAVRSSQRWFEKDCFRFKK